jgi:hypothetical protein
MQKRLMPLTTMGRRGERESVYFSLRAATPGSTLPSRSSSDAPPPDRKGEGGREEEKEGERGQEKKREMERVRLMLDSLHEGYISKTQHRHNIFKRSRYSTVV